MKRPRRPLILRADGHWWGYCDRCSFKVRNDHLKMEWTGLLCCDKTVNNCWEVRHPQDFVRGIPDKQTVFPIRDYDTGTGYVGGYSQAIAGLAETGTCNAGDWYPGAPGT